MKPNFRICPQCSTRNRLDKEFCVKCGEPLEGVAAGDPNDPGNLGQAEFFVSEDERKSSVVPILVGVVSLGVLGAGLWYLWDAGLPAAPEATTSAVPAQAQTDAPSSPVPPAPGVQEYSAGVAALRAGDFKAAVELLRSATEAAPTQADYRLALAEALEKAGEGPESLSEYERAAGLDSGNPRLTAQWAKALNRAGRNTEAIRAYETALDISPDNVANLRELSNLQMRANDFAAARPHLQRIVELQPDDLVPKQDFARALEATGDLPGAAAQYRAILNAMPGAEVSRALLSEVYMKDNRAAEALSVLDEGLAANPSSATLYREKGRVYDRLGNNAGAVAAYREYLKLAPTAPDARVFRDRLNQLSPSGEP